MVSAALWTARPPRPTLSPPARPRQPPRAGAAPRRRRDRRPPVAWSAPHSGRPDPRGRPCHPQRRPDRPLRRLTRGVTTASRSPDDRTRAGKRLLPVHREEVRQADQLLAAAAARGPAPAPPP